MILVTGATGHTGSEVVRALLERDQEVRVLVRDPAKSRRLFGDAVEPAAGDLADPATVRAALRGATTMFLSTADDPRRVAWETSAIDAAAAAGVRRIVKLSSIVAAPGAPVSFWDWHGRVEQHLSASGIPAVFLRSNFYMSNVLASAAQIATEGRLYAPAGAARIAMIDPRDVGAAAAAGMTGSGHDGRTYFLTGPEAITYAQVAGELAAATGNPVEFIDVPDKAARQGLTGAGLPDFVAEAIVAIFAQARQGAAERVTATIDSLTGAPARDFGCFARDHAQLFAPVAVGAGR
jgi:uncharacterized protein YbjT (DUF2867 family)